MRTGQFIVGMVNGVIEPYQTDGVERLLPEDNMRFLYELGKYNETGVFVHIWASEQAVSKTIITSKSDGEGRKGTVNHTVIIKIDSLADILDHTDFLKRLDSCFNVKYDNSLCNPLPEVKF